MSLVGTRPPTLDEWEKYEPHHRARMSFRPGLTGLWQVSGRSNITDFDEVVKLDQEYNLYFEGTLVTFFCYSGYRNTAIFVEGPMYSFLLSIAFYYEIILRIQDALKVSAQYSNAR